MSMCDPATVRRSLGSIHVGLRESWGYNPAELARIRRIVVARRDELVRKWDDFFGNP